MRVHQPGKIRDHFWYLGREESCVYLVEGRDESMIINGGFSYIVPDLLRQLKAFNIDESKITKLLLLHSHFDHVGIAPFFKRRDPELTLLASTRTWEVLSKPKVIDLTNMASKRVLDSSGMRPACQKYHLDWGDDISGHAVHEEDVIDLGDIEVSIFETPGHSSCSISAYIAEFKALFPSDACGIPYGDKLFIYGTSNYTQYQQSLEKLTHLELQLLCADHYGYIKGREAREHVQISILKAKEKRNLIEKTYARTGDLETTVEELIDVYRSENSSNLISPETFKSIYLMMVKHVVGSNNSLLSYK